MNHLSLSPYKCMYVCMYELSLSPINIHTYMNQYMYVYIYIYIHNIYIYIYGMSKPSLPRAFRSDLSYWLT